MGPQHDPISKPDSTSGLTFRDALGLAMELADEYAFVNAAATVAGDGRPLDLFVVEGIGATIEPMVGWLADTGLVGRTAANPRCGQSAMRPRGPAMVDVLLITVRPFDAEVIRESDLRVYRQSRSAFAQAGSNMIDWIETDGDLFRSYAYVTCPALAWADDPPGDRRSDGQPC